VGVGRGMGVLDGVVIVKGKRAEFGAAHCNQWGLCCVVVRVREPIELSFGVMSGVGLGIRVLDGGGDEAFPKLLWGLLLLFRPILGLFKSLLSRASVNQHF